MTQNQNNQRATLFVNNPRHFKNKLQNAKDYEPITPPNDKKATEPRDLFKNKV